jgi:EAL domain-containing protein (putative c-di-GMP-specific phosphodiesterase class I)
MHTLAKDKLTLTMDLSEALAGGQLFLVYQPTFDLRSEQVIGMEALLRWRHPTRGVLPPDVFIPLAEESNVIVPIGRWVLGEACRAAAGWQTRGHMLGVAVNVSARQLESDQLIDDVRDALAASGLEPGALTLEVTETTLMADADAAAQRLGALKELGVRIAIDDFGTGYSSLSYLRQFPADALKIDRSFVRSMTGSRQSTALVHTLVQLGRSLNLETLAEGIEDERQLRTLRREQCDQGQGFLFSRPLNEDQLEEFLRTASLGAPPLRAG